MRKLMFAMLFLQLGCEGGVPICEPTDLSISPASYSGDLMTQGVYYSLPEAGDPSEVVWYLILYRNGVILDGNRVGLPDLENRYANILAETEAYGGNCRYCWGAFEQSGQEIKLEKWIDDPCGEPVFRAEGRVLNDSSFVFRTYTEIDGTAAGAPLSVADTFVFRYFAEKPDSTNQYLP